MARRRDDWDEDDDERLPRSRSVKKQGSGSLWIWLVTGGVVLAAVVVVIIVLTNKTSEDKDGKPASGLIAHWSFDDVQNDTILDQSRSKNNAILKGGRLARGARGQAMWLDGQPDQFCDLGTSSDLNFSANSGFTFSGWVNTSEQNATILSLRHTQKNTQIDFVMRGGLCLAVIGDDNDPGTDNGFVNAKAINDGQWHHFAILHNGSTVELYLDGVSQGTGTGRSVAGPITTDLRALGSERLWIRTNDMGWGVPYFKGGIDEVRVYNRVLTADEIKELAKP